MDDGHVIRPPARDPVASDGGVPRLLRAQHPNIDASTALSLWGGEEVDCGYAVSVIADACALAEARAAPAG
jgi:hypothetical protein